MRRRRDYFDSLFEWPDVQSATDDPAQTFEVVRTERRAGKTWRVAVRFRYDTRPVVEWIDTVVVVQEKGRFVIDDVLYAGKGPFNRDGRLSDRLKACANVR